MGHTPAETIRLGDEEFLRCRWVPGDGSNVPWTRPEPPRTVVQALRNAKAILEREGAWMTGTWFKNEHPEVNPEDPFCNSWAVCAEGAVGIATLGVIKPKRPTVAFKNWQFNEGPVATIDPAAGQMYRLAVRALAAAGAFITGDPMRAAHAYNDGVFETREQVLDWFDKAITLAKTLEGDFTADLVEKHKVRERALRTLKNNL